MASAPSICEWLGLHEALRAFVRCDGGHQNARHIRPLHWHVACKLVVEGGFRPEEITPRPPFVAERKHKRWILTHDPLAGGSGERTVLGGLKTKAVDVVVTKDGVGPVLAVSIKGTLNAFRNLTNRMEEAVGDCANLHIAYPALVYGFLQVIRASRQGLDVQPNDVAVCKDGRIAEAIRRYHDVLTRLADRADIRDETTKYEAVALALVTPDPPADGELNVTFPDPDSRLLLEDFFQKLYTQYDQRFVYAAPALESTTRRLEWAPESPALRDPRIDGYVPRVASPS